MSVQLALKVLLEPKEFKVFKGKWVKLVPKEYKDLQVQQAQQDRIQMLLDQQDPQVQLEQPLLLQVQLVHKEQLALLVHRERQALKVLQEHKVDREFKV
jgi:hypothetical protein